MEIKIDCGDAGTLTWKLPDKLVASYKKLNIDEGTVRTVFVVEFEKPMQQFARILAAIANTTDVNMMRAAIMDLKSHFAICAAMHIKRLRGRK